MKLLIVPCTITPNYAELVRADVRRDARVHGHREEAYGTSLSTVGSMRLVAMTCVSKCGHGCFSKSMNLNIQWKGAAHKSDLSMSIIIFMNDF